MTKTADPPEAGKRRVTVRELVEGELDLIVGGGAKTSDHGGAERKKDPTGPGSASPAPRCDSISE